MKQKAHDEIGSDGADITRRKFLKTVGGVAIAAAAGGLAREGWAEPAEAVAPKASSETLVKSLHDSLTPRQREVICFPWEHPLRSKVDNNWRITKPSIGEFFSKDQQAMIEGIFRGLHSPEYIDKVLYHLDEDHPGGLPNYHIALFGAPRTGKFEWVLTGRHCTVRCDGDSLDGAAFGGPIFYGHAARDFYEKADHEGNVYWYQARRANEVFQALDGKQRSQALLPGPIPGERSTETVKLQADKARIEGLPVSAMKPDQRELVGTVMRDLLLPFRKADAEEAVRYIEANGGLEGVKMAFYKSEDIGGDGIWDVWKLESPTMIWYFRGAPHVHTWVNIRSTPPVG
jgi:hypothetical protein